MKKRELKTISIDDYLLDYFFWFVRQPTNHERLEKGFRLKENTGFSYLNAPNRLPSIVDDGLFFDILLIHLDKHTYN